jgi:chemotaxis protein CheX
MKVEWLNPFIEAAAKVLSGEVGVQAVRGELSLRREAYLTDDVTTMISVVGDVRGIALYGMTFDTAKAIVSRMMGQPLSTFDELAQSGIAELGNVITGQAGIGLAAQGFETDISVPMLIVGKGSRISTLDYDRLVVPLNTEIGVFRVDLALRESNYQATK